MKWSWQIIISSKLQISNLGVEHDLILSIFSSQTLQMLLPRREDDDEDDDADATGDGPVEESLPNFNRDNQQVHEDEESLRDKLAIDIPSFFSF